MTDWLKFIGLANLLFFWATIFLLVKISSKIDLKKDTISCLSKEKKTCLPFGLVLFIFSIGQVVFAIRATQFLADSISSKAIPLFIAGGVTLNSFQN